MPDTKPDVKPLPFWLQISINSGVVALRQVLHNPAQAAHYKEVLLDLFVATKTAFADDPDFQ